MFATIVIPPEYMWKSDDWLACRIIVFYSFSKISHSLWSCISVYVNRKLAWIDDIGSQMQASYRTLVRNFF